MNRQEPPYATLPSNVKIPEAETHQLSNGIKVYVVNKGEIDVCRIDFLFSAGSCEQQVPLQANGTISLMVEGTKNRSSQQIAEQLEYLGSYINRTTYSDFARFSVFTVNRNLKPTLALIEEVIKEPVFPNEEIDIWQATGKQELTVSLEKTSTLAQRRFIQSVFGNKHPYSIFASPSDYDTISRSHFNNFHRKHFGSQSCQIFISGRVTNQHLTLLNEHFGNSIWGENHVAKTPSAILSEKNLQFVYKDNSVQSTLRVGRSLFPRNHADYPKMAIVSSLLGGYFGSRLMKNLREDKGYTYGVHATMLPYAQTNVFQIGTDVGTKHTQPALHEILYEIKRIQSDPIDEDELQLVKGSLIGQFLRTLNGQFSIADSLTWLLYLNNLDYGFYRNMLDTISSITPIQITEHAKKWLNEEDLIICVAGTQNPFE